MTERSDRARGERLSRVPEPTERYRRTASQRRLRRVLERYGDCLTRLSDSGRRIVILRVGTDGRRPLSRRQVARRLDIPVTRVVEGERTAVRRLSNGPADCSTGAGQGDSSSTLIGGSSSGVGDIDTRAAARGLGALLGGNPGAVAGSGTAADAGEVAGASASGSESPRAEANAEGAVRGTLETPLGTFNPTAPVSVIVMSLLAVLAALAAIVLARKVRREQRLWGPQ